MPGGLPAVLLKLGLHFFLLHNFGLIPACAGLLAVVPWFVFELLLLLTGAVHSHLPRFGGQTLPSGPKYGTL